MAKLFLVRHGQSEFNAGLTDKFNSSITSRGADQATRAAMTLREGIADPQNYVGLVSPYARCLQTALVISKYTGIKFNVDSRLGESPEDVHREISNFVKFEEAAYPDFRWDGREGHDYTKESESAYKGRLESFVGSLDGKMSYVVVSHMTPITHLIRQICFNNDRALMTISNCSISLIEDKKPIYLGRIP